MEGQGWKLAGALSKWKQKGVQEWVSLFLLMVNNDNAKF